MHAHPAGPGPDSPSGPGDRIDPPAWHLTLADSELAAVDAVADGHITLRLAAAQLRHPHSGAPGHAPGLSLIFGGAELVGTPAPGRLREARLWLDGRWQAGCPVPGHWAAAQPGHTLRLEVTGAWGDTWQLTASSLTVALPPGGLNWQPWLHC